jgi:hypothetical protein
MAAADGMVFGSFMHNLEEDQKIDHRISHFFI